MRRPPEINGAAEIGQGVGEALRIETASAQKLTNGAKQLQDEAVKANPPLHGTRSSAIAATYRRIRTDRILRGLQNPSVSSMAALA
jgi:hypothetical protein